MKSPTDPIPDLAVGLRQVVTTFHRQYPTDTASSMADGFSAHLAATTCPGLPPGNADILRAVLRQAGLTEDWESKPGRTRDEVLARLASVTITPGVLAATFGPEANAVVSFLRQTAGLSAAQLKALNDAPVDSARGTAVDASLDAAVASGLTEVQEFAAEATALLLGMYLVYESPILDAVNALTVRSVVGEHGFEQSHYDLLTGCWRGMVGPVHPADPQL